jgi:hypothetical protein
MAGSSGLEAVLRITAKDEAGAAFSTLKAQIAAIDKQIATFDKLMNAVGKVAPGVDPLIRAIGESTKALEAQKLAVAQLSEGLDASEGAAAAAAGGQERLRAAIMDTTRVMAVQGVEAARVAERIVQAQRRQRAAAREGGGLRGRLAEAAPFLGPVILHEEVKGLEAGVSVQDEMARLRAAGATGAQIESARGDFRDFSKTHSGVLESDYLAGFRDARVIAPGEMFEMARLGATYRAGLRNSGLSSSEEDVGNVLRIMDELGLKNMGQREDFLDNFLKSQQAFGSQISSETALAAYRNAKQSIYDWSPEFRNKYFPTLLQSAGQQGGTEMMTALNNYIGQHMQQSELRALVSAGFVRPGDLITNKVGDVKGLKPGAQLFEADTFKSNIAQWAWDFHDTFMNRKGATEGGFDNLIARMPRNMAALVAFLNHNRGRIQRDASTLDTPIGLKAADDATLANNPGAGLAALRDAITQFSATITSPAVAAAAPAMQGLAHAIQSMSAAAGDFAKQHPQAATAASAGGIAAVTGTGLWLTAKLWSGISKFLGLGGGSAGAAAGGSGAAAAGGGLARIIGGVAGAASLPGLIDLLTDDRRSPAAKANDAAVLDKIRSWIWGPGPGAPMALPGASPASPIGTPLSLYRPLQGRDVHSPSTGPFSYYPAEGGKEVSVSGEARIDHEITVRIEPSPLLTAIVDQSRQKMETTIPLIGGGSGRMDSDAGPTRVGIGHM